mmetsp:Transcript_21539/g.59933  ORF Transcript_21539/g.59933 Transcript_21539/m.59933 type:complete len:238 (+) Transcript_21539:365-1078(+)
MQHGRFCVSWHHLLRLLLSGGVVHLLRADHQPVFRLARLPRGLLLGNPVPPHLANRTGRAKDIAKARGTDHLEALLALRHHWFPRHDQLGLIVCAYHQRASSVHRRERRAAASLRLAAGPHAVRDRLHHHIHCHRLVRNHGAIVTVKVEPAVDACQGRNDEHRHGHDLPLHRGEVGGRPPHPRRRPFPQVDQRRHRELSRDADVHHVLHRPPLGEEALLLFALESERAGEREREREW